MSNKPPADIFTKSDKPNLPHDDTYRYENDSYYDASCPNCNESLADHTDKQRIKCALECLGGIPH